VRPKSRELQEEDPKQATSTEDQRLDPSKQPNKDQEGSENQSRTNATPDAFVQENAPQQDAICPICGKILSHMVEEFRNVHVNKFVLFTLLSFSCLITPNSYSHLLE